MSKKSLTQTYRHRGHLTKEKMHRKIRYLRHMNKPNDATPGGATRNSWHTWWSVLMKLRLVPKKTYY